TIDLSPLDETECNDLLLQKGFYKKPHSVAQVPDEYLNGPYIEIKVEAKNSKVDL
ncbi:selenoprotein M precursor, partial [Biomphalaria pfeifferi]